MKSVCAKHFGTFKSCNPSCMSGWKDQQTIIKNKIVKLLNKCNAKIGIDPLGLEIASMIDALEGK